MKLNTDQVAEFSNFIVDAARLRLYGLRHDAVIERSTFGTSNIIYAVDTDIVKLFSAPSNVGGGNLNYGRVFRSDTPEHSTALSEVVADHIFYRLTRLPVFQLSPHAAETGIVYDGVAANAYKKSPYEAFIERYFQEENAQLADHIALQNKDDIEEFRSKLINQSVDLKTKNEFFEGNVEKIIRMIWGRPRDNLTQFDFQREFTRYLQIKAEGRLITYEALLELLRSSNVAQGSEFSLQLERSIPELIRDSQRKSAWISRLAKEKNTRSPRIIEVDAEALAELEALNEKFWRYGIKVVLITGDEGIHRAVRTLEQKEFGSYPVVHPSAFLVAGLAAKTTEDNRGRTGKQFQKWLDGLLTLYTGDRRSFRLSIEALANGERDALEDLQKTIATLHDNIADNVSPFIAALEEWEGLKLPAITLSLGYERSEQHLFRRLLVNVASEKDRRKVQESIEELRRRSLARMDQLWDNVLIRFTSAGVGILYALRGGSGQKQRIRNPPVIRFDSFPAATELVAELVKQHTLKEISSPSLTERLEDIKKNTVSKELGNTDLGYLSCLVYAVICSAENKWYVARGLAERAVRISESEPIVTKSGSLISGREAYYFVACALRMTISISGSSDKLARELDQAEEALKSAEGYITKALNALEREQAFDQSRGKLKKTTKGFRFLAERTAIELTRIHLGRWFRHAVEESSDKALLLMAQIRHQISEIKQLSEGKNPEEFASSAKTATAHLLINAIQCVHICAGTHNETEAWNQLRTMPGYEHIRSYFNGEGNEAKYGLHRTFLIDAYLLFSDVMSGLASKTLRKSFKNQFDNHQNSIYAIMPYDDKRFRHLFSYMSTHLETLN